MQTEFTREQVLLRQAYTDIKKTIQKLITVGIGADKIDELIEGIRDNTTIDMKKFETTDKHAHWNISSDGYYPYCSSCYYEPDSDAIWTLTLHEQNKGALPARCAGCFAYMDEED